MITLPFRLLVRGLRRLLGSATFMACLAIICLVGLTAQIYTSQPHDLQRVADFVRQDISRDLDDLIPKLNQFVEQEVTDGPIVTPPEQIDIRSSEIQLNLATDNLKAARKQLRSLQADLTQWQIQLARQQKQRQLAQQLVPSGEIVTAPILLYHYPPPDFEAQLQALLDKGYTTIDLDQLAAAVNSQAPLPPKPVVITFDDGFSNQMQAFALLQKYNMKATYYIVNGGERSQYCLGANRRSEANCGDAYLGWNEIRSLDASGLITIAAHTVDHARLATLDLELQRFEILASKNGIEAELGHPIRHFAYPYGSFSGTTIALVKEAG